MAGIAVPFTLAALMTPSLLKVPGLLAPGISQLNATLFMGACVALTAFPCWRASSTNAALRAHRWARFPDCRGI
jgi:hypothetical protein